MSWMLTSQAVLESDLLKRIPWLSHGFGTRLSGDWPGEYTSLKQIHSDVALVAEGDRTECLGEGDALVTSRAGQRIGIRTADCVPILFADPENRIVASAHAGWRGTVAEIACRTIERMQDLGAEPARVHAAIGPSIGKCCFSVGSEVAERFLPYFPEDNFLTHVDLPAANYRQLLRMGLQPELIDIAGLCTACDAAQFHSFRRDKHQAGRMVAAIGILQ
jgi:YfiH family protein